MSDQLNRDMKSTPWVSPLVLMDVICTKLSRRVSGAGGHSSSDAKSTFLWEKAVTYGLERVHCVTASLGMEGLPKIARKGAVVVLDRPINVVVRAAYFARAVFEVLYDSIGEEKLRGISLWSHLSLFRRACSWPESDFDKNAKYFCIRPMAQHLHQELPSEPSTSYGPVEGGDWLLFTGAMRVVLRNRVVSFNKKNLKLMESLLQGVKRACFQVSPTLVESTLRKHSATLKADLPLPNLIFENEKRDTSSFTENPLLSYIHRTIHALFKKPMGEPKLYEPSTSASAATSRKEGGAQQEVENWLESVHLLDIDSSELLTMEEDRPGHVGERRSRRAPDFKAVIETMASEYHLKELKYIVPANVVELGVEPSARTQFLQDLWNLRETPPPKGEDVPETKPGVWHAPTGVFQEVGDYSPPQPPPTPESFTGPKELPNLVRIAPVLEPLKVRLVSAGEALPYWLSQYFQKYMWSALQTSPIFRLTGRPLMEADLHDLDTDSDAGMWVSGDYSGATDSVKLGWTVLAFEEILRVSDCPPLYAKLLRRVIYGQELTYKGLEELNGPQLSGQLMGSTLSFPILCILNLAAFWKASEITLKARIPFKELNVLVNGDDILFRAPSSTSRLYRVWKRTVAEVGFQLSPGKNYVHPNYLCVNSEGYHYSPATRRLTKVGYFNVGLLVGQAKVSRREVESVSPIQTKYAVVLEGACDKFRAHKRFFHYNLEHVLHLTGRGRYSPFIDPLLGGLGMPLHQEVRKHVYFTRFQQDFASYLRHRIRKVVGKVSDIKHSYLGIVAPRTSLSLVKTIDRTWGTYHLVPRMEPLFQGEEVVSKPLDPVVPLNRLYLKSDELPSVQYPNRDTLRYFRRYRDQGRVRKVPDDELSRLSTDRWWVRVPLGGHRAQLCSC